MALMNIVSLLLLMSALRLSLGQLQLGQLQEASLPIPAYEDPVTSFDCAPCLDTEFCGRDLECHPYSCEAWYNLGHPFFTGYAPGSSEDLTCIDLVEDRTFLREAPICGGDLPLAAEYIAPNASSTACFYPNREEQLVTYSFTRKCTAQPTNETGFICYDISPNTDFDAYTKDYVEQSQATNNGKHNYKLYMGGYTMRQGEGYKYPYSILQLRGLGGEGDRSVFNATAARAAMHAKAFLIFDSPLPTCEGGCLLNEFCGIDGLCHGIDCDNFWEYGTVEFTGNGNDSELNCTLELQESALNPCDGEWPVALEYRCNEVNKFSAQPHVCQRNGGARHLPFHRMCTAQPNPSQDFICFDLKGVESVEDYAAEYVQSTTDNPECTDAELDPYALDSGTDRDTIEWAAYHYQTHRINNDTYGTSLYLKAPYDRASEDEPLNLNSLEHAMFAKLVGAAPVALEDDEFASAAAKIKTGRIALGLLTSMAYVLIL